MKQSKRSTLHLLIDLAKARSDKALLSMLHITANVQESQRKFDALEKYLGEYEQRLSSAANTGMDVGQLSNFHLFLSKLGQAVDQQALEMSELEDRGKVARGKWQAEERKHLTFETLQRREQARQDTEDARRSQKLLDSFVSQRAAAKAASEV